MHCYGFELLNQLNVVICGRLSDSKSPLLNGITLTCKLPLS